MPTPTELAKDVSDPASPNYDPDSPHYDVTADSSSPFYVGEVNDEARSGDEIREDVTSWVKDNPLAGLLSDTEMDRAVQGAYFQELKEAQRGLDEGLQLRSAGHAPKTLWDNASHEQMIEALNSHADSAAVAETSEEWVALGNELTVHQRTVADAIDSSMADWTGEGGDAARRHMAEFARWLGDTARGAELAGRQQQIHSQTLNEAQKLMQANPPVDFSAEDAHRALGSVTDPVAYAVQAAVVSKVMEQKEQARTQAARVMTQFDDIVGSAVDMPVFTPPPELAQLQERTTTTGGGAATAGSQSTAGVNGTPAAKLPAPGPGPAVHGTAGPAPAVHGTVPGMPGGSGPGGTPLSPEAPEVPEVPDMGQLSATGEQGTIGTDASFNPPGFTSRDTVSPNLSPPDSRSFDASEFGVGSGQVGDLASLDGYSGTSASSYSGPDPASLSANPPGAGKLPGPNWSGTGGDGSIASKLGGVPGSPGFGGPAAGGLVGGAGGGVGGGAAAPGATSGTGKSFGTGLNQAAGARFATGPASSGPGGMMAGGAPAGGARQSEDDKEHRVAGYLDDEDNLFDTERVIAPPVIGDWSNDDWQ